MKKREILPKKLVGIIKKSLKESKPEYPPDDVSDTLFAGVCMEYWECMVQTIANNIQSSFPDFNREKFLLECGLEKVQDE